MIKQLLFGLCILLSVQSYSITLQDRLNQWDPIRGEYVYQHLNAIVYNKNAPLRTFPEKLTLFELLVLIPETDRQELMQAEEVDPAIKNLLGNLIARTSCKPEISRSFGDPHIVTNKGKSFSFQTVGEFRLLYSEQFPFEIQTRQQPQQDDFSLNTAVAMLAGTDKISIYANEKPDRNEQSALRVNSLVVLVENGIYECPGGALVRYATNTYTVDFPTGESIKIECRKGKFGFLNLTMRSFPCSTTYGGVASGEQTQDRTNGIGEATVFAGQLGAVYEEVMTREFAEWYRVSDNNTLFDYALGMSTASYTDRSYPRIHHSIAELDPIRKENSLKKCREEGVTEEELNGCVFDHSFLQIPPSPRPILVDNTTGIVFSKPSVNTPRIPVEGGVVREGADPVKPTPPAQPIPQVPVSEKKIPSVPIVKPKKVDPIPQVPNSPVPPKPNVPPVKIPVKKPGK